VKLAQLNIVIVAITQMLSMHPAYSKMLPKMNLYEMPKGFDRKLGLDAYFKLYINHALEISQANSQIKTAKITIDRNYKDYIPTPSLSSSIQESMSKNGDNNTKSQSHSVGLKVAGDSPYGLSYSMDIPALSKSFSETDTEPPQSSTNFSSNIGFQISFRLLKDSYFVLGNAKDLTAELSWQIANLQLRQTIIQQLANAQKAYFDVIFSHFTKRVRKRAVASAKELLNEIKALVKEGEKAKLSLLQVELQIAQSEDAEISANIDFENTYEAFLDKLSKNSMDKTVKYFPDPKALSRNPAILKLDLKSLVAKARKNQPGFLISKRQLELQKISMKRAKSSRWPSLDLVASRGAPGSKEQGWGALAQSRRREQPTTSIGLSFNYILANDPVSDSYRQSLISYAQAEIDFREAERALVKDIKIIINTVAGGKRRLKASALSLNIAEKKFEAEYEKFKEGLSRTRDLVDYQNEVDDARISAMRTRADFFNSLFSLYQAVGEMPRGWKVIGGKIKK
jgi:outer membrane protein TolC